VQKLLDVTSPAEDGYTKVQNIWVDNEDDNLERATEECFPCEEKKEALCYRCKGCGICVHENCG
jgi:hypothetical protein